MFDQFATIRTILLEYLRPEDRRRVYVALRLRVEIDANGDARLSGIFDLDIGDLLPNEGTYLVSLDPPDPPPFEGVVTLDSSS